MTPRCKSCGQYAERRDLGTAVSVLTGDPYVVNGDCAGGHGMRPIMTDYIWAACADLHGTVMGLNPATYCDDYDPPQLGLFGRTG